MLDPGDTAFLVTVSGYGDGDPFAERVVGELRKFFAVTIYIDPLYGKDDNSGLSSVSALASFDEAARRSNCLSEDFYLRVVGWCGRQRRRREERLAALVSVGDLGGIRAIDELISGKE